MLVVVAVVALVLLVSPLAVAQPWQYCGSSARYSPNSTYQANLDAMAAALPRNASSSPALFAKAAQGAGPADDRIFALTLCRGDSDAAACLDCVAGAFRYARRSCPYDKEVAVLYDACFLYFSGVDFLRTTANVGQISLSSTQNVTDADGPAGALFTRRLRELPPEVRDGAHVQRQRRASRSDDVRGGAVHAGPAPRRLLFLPGGADREVAAEWPDGRRDDCRRTLRLPVRELRLLPRGAHAQHGDAAPAVHSADGRPTFRKTKNAVDCIDSCSNCGNDSMRILLQMDNKAEKREVKLDEPWRIQDIDADFTLFDFPQMMEATGNFSEENKLGQGGFGSVYKGQLPNGLQVAVKRLASHSSQGFVEFKNEIHLIAKLQHTNLVRLLGCCVHGEEHMLIYEYMQNKSLDFFIFDVTRARLLTWKKRLHIIEGIAQGLLYLHKLSRLRIIHRDLKASNILLDNDMNPKISDFGLAKIFSPDAIQGNTNRVVGTYGYMSPEYASDGVFSVKTDVYSFGVLLLEIISGRRNAGFHHQGAFFNLLGYAWKLWMDGRWFELVDASIEIADNQDQTLEILKCINIALMCVQESAADRPTMSDVVAMLSMETMSSLPHPKQPAYFNVSRTDRELSTTELCSANDVSVSILEGR
ncbi:hypothetical protein ACP70R_001601 [Stipagrostis hirtigluma subsp. patula]